MAIDPRLDSIARSHEDPALHLHARITELEARLATVSSGRSGVVYAERLPAFAGSIGLRDDLSIVVPVNPASPFITVFYAADMRADNGAAEPRVRLSVIGDNQKLITGPSTTNTAFVTALCGQTGPIFNAPGPADGFWKVINCGAASQVTVSIAGENIAGTGTTEFRNLRLWVRNESLYAT